MAEYEKEFSHLSKYAPQAVLTEAFRCRQFKDGQHDSIKRYLAPVTSLQQVNFYQLIQAAMKVERLETRSKEKSQKKKFSQGASSSSDKRARDVQDESIQGSATIGRRQGGTALSSAGRGASVRQGEILKCTHFHRRHSGICRLLTGGCFRCGSLEHLIAQCPREPRDNRSQQGSGKERFATPLSTRDRGRGLSGPSQHRGQGGIVLETVDRPMPTVTDPIPSDRKSVGNSTVTSQPSSLN